MAPIAGLACNATTQIVCVNLLKVSIRKSILTGFGSGFFATAAMVAVNAAVPKSLLEITGSSFVAAVTYIALGFCYWAFLNLGMTSLRIRMLRELLRAGSTITQSDLLQRYSPTEVMERRLERLRRGGDLDLRDGVWRLQAPRLYYAARVMDVLRAIVLPASARKTI